MTWLDFVALIAATGVPVNAWLYEDSIIAGWREWFIAWGDYAIPADAADFSPTLWQRSRARIAQLLSCRFCMSHWVPVMLIVAFFIPSLWMPSPWSTVIKFPVYFLAATRFSLILGYAANKLRHRDSDPEADTDNKE
jgi:hypothetical protein